MNPGGTSGEGASGILKAVGSLLMALSGADQRQVERTLDEMQSPEPARPPAPGPAPRARPQAPGGIPGYPGPQGRPPGAEGASGPPREAIPREHEQPGELLDEVEFVLADARERAQRIIDESMDRARELIRQERAAAAPTVGIDPRAFDDLRRGLRDLVTEVRDIQQRLARIEQLLREQGERSTAAGASRPASGFPAPAPTRGQPGDAGRPRGPYAAPPADEPLPAWQAPGPEPERGAVPAPSDESKPEASASAEAPRAQEFPSPNQSAGPAAPTRFEAPHYTPPPELTAEADQRDTPPQEVSAGASPAEANPPTASPAAASPAPAPPRSPFSVVPPQRREWAGEAEPGGAPRRAPEARSWDAAPAQQDHQSASSGPLVTFLPSDGAITLRVTPVAGFQGLMRIQDALARQSAVGHASVEAYSQGEARLQLELVDSTDSDELAEGLARALQGSARVEEASEVHWELLITLR